MTTLSLQAGKEHRFLRGERTVYAGEVAHIEGEITLGGEADVVSSRGQFLGRGFLSPSSKQLLRIVTRERRPLDESLFEELLREAIAYRRMLGNDSCCRLVFGDADSLPGLTVDRFESVLSIQTLTAGMDQRKEILCDLLERLLHPAAIYERNDVAVRKKEGLPLKKGLLRGSLPSELLVRENGFLIKIDVEKGQKTGSYLDQRENHAAIAPYVSGKQVLDACCCTGGFGLHAAGYGAEFVTASDISADALEQARENYARNGFDRVEFIEADVFELLREYERQGRQFDVVILDPPAFCKNKSALEKACRGYKEINLRALRLLPKGGILVTNSCSHYLTPELFWEVLRSAAEDAGKGLRVIEQRIQSRDHPVTLGEPQSLYLKCMILQVI